MAAESVTMAYKAQVTTTEVLGDASVPAAPIANRTIVHSGFNTTKTLNASSDAPTTRVAAFDQALTAGAATINLTALVGTNGITVNGTGLKVQVLRLKAPATNGNPVTITPGAANGYDFMGASMSLTLNPDDEVTLYSQDNAPDIGATDCELDLAGTGTDALEVLIAIG